MEQRLGIAVPEIGADGGQGDLGRKPLFHEVQTRIRAYIYENNLKPGEMLPPAPEMAKLLGVSLASLREGLRAMEALSMLETRHGVGTFVCNCNLAPVLEMLSFNILFDQDGLLKLIQIREAMEVGLIRDVVTRISDDDLQQLELLCAQAAETSWKTDFDMAFHRTLYRCLDNALIAQLLDIYWLPSLKLIDRTVFSASVKKLHWQDHHTIVLALKARDQEAAVTSMCRHFENAKTRLQRVSAPTPSPSSLSGEQ